MNVSFLFYLGTRAFVRAKIIKCFVAIFKGRKSGQATFILDKINFKPLYLKPCTFFSTSEPELGSVTPSM